MKKPVAGGGRIPHREQTEHSQDTQTANAKTKFAPPIPATPQAAQRFRQELDNSKSTSH